MLKKDLAAALDISVTMVRKLEARGMPTDSVEAARIWRNRHLQTGYRKEYRLHGYRKPQRQAQRQQHDDGVDPDRTLDAVELLGIAAELLVRAGQPLTPVEPLLRDALRRVPVDHRDRIRLRGNDDEVQRFLGKKPVQDAYVDVDDADAVPFPLCVWHALVDPVLQAVRAEQDKIGEPDELTDDEVDQMAEFWYQAAAGEVSVQ